MKAILEFHLPDNQEDFDNALKGSTWMFTLYQLDQYLRSQIKYPEETISDDTYKAFEKIREKLYELLNENNLKL